MQPPWMPRLDLKAPISSWKQLGSYDTASECQKEMSKLYQSNVEVMKHMYKTQGFSGDWRENLLVEASLNSLCIASDDPRLK